VKKFSCIYLSGGTGTRMKLDIPKQFLSVGGKPILVHVLERIDNIEEVEEIIIPSPRDYIEKTEDIIRNYGFSTEINVIDGGRTRQESVYKGLQIVKTENVIIHEAVRPFVTKNDFIELINTKDEAAFFGIDIPFTVLEGRSYIEKILKRDRLINVQLPQRFPTEKLIVAHENAIANGLNYTEDASLYFDYYKTNIRVLKGNEYNLKITKPIDRKLAEIIYKEYILGEE
jgi:D-ribitol-5-phosphate cytidylyltransferase